MNRTTIGVHRDHEAFSAADVHDRWLKAARTAGIDRTGFEPSADLETRLAWARGAGLKTAGVLARQSTKMQHSIDDQVRECVECAAGNRLYAPPEYVCADTQTGRKSDRSGLNRMRSYLAAESVTVLVVCNLSRLFRSAHRGYAFIQEVVVDEGLRAISVSQCIDTENGSAWKLQTMVHGMTDESLLTSLADHVRAGQVGCFLQGCVTGALTVGYRAVEAPEAGPNRVGATRRKVVVHADAAPRIVRAYESVRDGMPIRVALRQWIADGGPCDPRATTGRMTPPAFRRLLSNPRYLGRWAFGRKRNRWVNKKDQTVQFDMPADQVKEVQREDLRIVSDELFHSVQRILEGHKSGPRGPRKAKQSQLADLVTDVFRCARCNVRFYNFGGKGRGMICKWRDGCPCRTTIIREEAVRNVCRAISECLAVQGPLMAEIAARASILDAAGDGRLESEAEGLRKQIEALTRKMEHWLDLVGDGSPADCKSTKERIRGARQESAALRERLAHLESRRNKAASPITVEEVRTELSKIEMLLVDGASGRLGDDLVHRAAAAFRLLVGGRIDVHVESRPGRKSTTVYGSFRPEFLRSLPAALGVGEAAPSGAMPEVRAWLRKRPSRDVLGPRVYELMDVQGLSYRAAAKVLQEEGHRINSGVVWQCRRRHYEILGLPFPAKFVRRKNRPKSDTT